MEVKRVGDWDYEMILNLCQNEETPFYIIDLDRIENNHKRLVKNLSSIDRVDYAIKSNSNTDILKRLKESNQEVNLECSSIPEVKKSMKVGFSPDELHCSLVNPPDRAIEGAVKISEYNKEFTVTAGAIDTLKRLREAGFRGKVLFRLRVGLHGPSSLVSEGASLKFGISRENIIDAYNIVKKSEFDFEGLHAHAGSCILSKEEIDNYLDMIKYVFKVSKDIPGEVSIIDIGGGIGVPYKEDISPIDLDYLDSKISEVSDDDFEGNLIIEPGRYISADSSLILSKVNTIKEFPNQNSSFVGIDCGLNEMIRPAMFGSYHPIGNISNPEAEPKNQTIAGPTCSKADIMCSNRKLPMMKRDDIIAIGNAGAYGEVLSNNFHSLPKVKTIVVEGNKTRTSVKRQSIDELFRREGL